MGALAAGATLVVVDRFSASRFWGQVREAEATVVNFIGMMMPVLTKNPQAPDDRDNTVRLFYGSPSFSPEFLSEFQERFGTDIIVGFGMTETCYGTIEGIGGERRAGSSGLPPSAPRPRLRQPGAHRRPGDRPACGRGHSRRNHHQEPGYHARSIGVTRSRPRRRCATAGSIPATWAGWTKTASCISWTGRRTSSAAGGENISSQEVENVIKRNPDVLDCAVLAVPSELGEDELKAYVTPRPGAKVDPEAVIYWCAEHLAYFKVPRYLEIREELPRTPSLRVRKDVLRREREDLIAGCFDREAAGISLR